MMGKKKMMNLVLIGITAITVVYITFVTPQIQRVEDAAFFQLHLKESDLSTINHTKTVLMVKTPYWGFRFNLGRLGFVNAGCNVSNCVLTTNHSYVKDYNFDAFVIHVPTQRKGVWTLPNRRQDQMFVLFSTEPPVNMPPMDPFNNYFNWTMTYLPESDFHLPYGRIEPLPGAPTTESERIFIQDQIRKSKVNPALGKSKLAIWTVSNCNARSNRMDYVKEMQKYIDIDIFSTNGKCGKAGFCPRNKNNECLDHIEKTYKFYLAFENSICREYVTEKFFNSIGRNLVPIVLGGANYSAIAPKHSYINALDYTPRQLAEYLQQLDQDDSLYAEYFWWKPYYRVMNLVQTNQIAFCKLCAALHDNPVEEKIVRGVKKWYINDSKCIDRPNFKLLSVKDATINQTAN